VSKTKTKINNSYQTEHANSLPYISISQNRLSDFFLSNTC